MAESKKFGLAILLATGFANASPPPSGPEWTGFSPYRVLVRVEPRLLIGRERDEAVARLAVDCDEVLRIAGLEGNLDLSTLQVHRYVFWGASFRPSDWNADGDEDLMIQSEFYAFWAERSFLEHGYSPAVQIAPIQKRAR